MNSRVYILGGAQTDFSRNWKKEGKNEVALLREVLTDGLNKAGISFDDVKELNKDNRIACFVGNFIAEKYCNQGHLGALLTEVDSAFYGVPSARYEAACASGSVALDAAISKIQSGVYDVAIVVGWELMKTVDSKTCGDILGCAAYFDKEAKGIDFPFSKLFGRLADELIVKYKLNEARFMKDLALIAKNNIDNAKRNPLAQTRNWFINLEEACMRGTDTNPYVGGRLARTDCSQITDGAAILVLVSENYAKKLNKKLPSILGFGHRVAPMFFDKKIQEGKTSPYILPWTRQAVLDAFKRSGKTIQDIDVIETHDCFTSSEYAAISAFGITEPGHEFEAIEDGVIAFDGRYPINCGGGLIGCGHPVGASGVRMMLDLYKQLSGNAGTYQLKKATTGMMLNIGGSATTNYVFVVGKDE